MHARGKLGACYLADFLEMGRIAVCQLGQAGWKRCVLRRDKISLRQAVGTAKMQRFVRSLQRWQYKGVQEPKYNCDRNKQQR